MAKAYAGSTKTQHPETCTHTFRTYTEESGLLMQILCNTCGLELWNRQRSNKCNHEMATDSDKICPSCLKWIG